MYLFQHLHGHARIEDLFSRINRPLDDIVDAKLEDLKRVYHTGNLCPFRRNVFHKLAHGQNVKIQILGGSVTVGADLKNPKVQRWSNQFENIMNGGWYNNTLSVINNGKSACNVDSWIYFVGEFNHADLVIVDLSVNDQGFPLQALPQYYRSLIQLLDELPNHPAIMFTYAFRTARYDKKDIHGHCPNPEGQGTCCDGYLYCKKWYDMQDFVAQVLDEFKIPFVSYRDLVWPDYNHPSPNLPAFWNGLSHPDHKAHSLIAKMVAYGFGRQIVESHVIKHCNATEERYVIPSRKDVSIRPVCASPLTNMQATEEASSIHNFHLHAVTSYHKDITIIPAHEWSYYNDSKNKYGWILNYSLKDMKGACPTLDILKSFECQNYSMQTTLSFQMEFGNEPILQVNYLKSYSDEMGTVKLWLDDDYSPSDESKYVLLSGKWRDPYSIHHHTTIARAIPMGVSPLVLGDVMLLSTLSPGKHIVHISAFFQPGEDKRKWKLLGLVSC
jgi:hypothetical protein